MALVFAAIGAGVARADSTWTQTSQSDFEAGTLFQVDTSSSPGDVRLAASGVGSNYIYAFRGHRSKDFWRYDTSANSWVSLADAPDKVEEGGSLACNGINYIYALRGNDTKDFWRYDIPANSWTTLADAPEKVRYGGALAYDGSSYIYALRGDDTKTFWRYDISDNSWTTLANAPGCVRGVEEGGALASDGSNYVYALRGNYSRDFWRYNISDNSWTTLTHTPCRVRDGGALAYDGSDYIYALRGNCSKTFWRYDISDNSWISRANTPHKVNGGGALACDGSSYIYALRGNDTKTFWRYDISANSWTSRANTPDEVDWGGALTMGGVSYQSSGTLTSSAHDTGSSANFGAISWSDTSPAATTVEFQIATNSDNSTWNFRGPDGGAGTYYTSGGSGIWTGHDGDRYIKYKAFLSTTDTSQTPSLHDVSITYTQQIALPAVTTANATLVEETAATLNGTLDSDGGEACQYRFVYGTSESGPYPDSTGWTGSKTTGQSFSADVTSLGEGIKYYFRAQARNSAGATSGSELHFLTKPDAPDSFSAVVVGDTQIDLSWTKGDGADKTLVLRKEGSYPGDRSDGDQVYFDAGTSVSDTGLSPGVTYYYRAWSEASGCQQWSDGYASASATTGGGEVPMAVGGIVYPVNKARVLAPWLILILTLSAAIAGGTLGLRKSAWRRRLFARTKAHITRSVG